MIRSALQRRASIGLAALALGLALGGCDDLRKMTGMDSGTPAANTVAPATNTAAGTGPSLSAPQSGSTANPLLAQQIAAAAQQLNANTPTRVDEITTLTAVRSSGTDIMYEMAVSQVLPPAQLDQLRMIAQNSNQTNLCANINAANLIRMGATMTHYYTDPNGTRFQTSVVSCPG